VDVRREETAVREANALNIPIIAMVDTNCDPDRIDLVIPANDDAIRAIKLIVSRMADAVLEGMNMRKEAGLPVEVVPEPEEYEYEYASAEEEDERYLGEATLAKLRGGELFPALLSEEDFEAAIAEEDVEALAEDEGELEEDVEEDTEEEE